MKPFFLLLCLSVFYAACNNTSQNTSINPDDIDSALALKNNGGREYDSSHLTLVGTFEGVLPCADCGGIKTELNLYQDIANAENNTYTLTETYLGKLGDTSFSSNGKWDVLKGIKGDDTAIVYFLNYDEPDDSRYYLKKGDTSILLLDKEQKIIQSALNYSLRRK